MLCWICAFKTHKSKPRCCNIGFCKLGAKSYRTEPLYVKDTILWVRVHTPVIRTQLSLKRLQLIEQLNRRVKHNVISDIRFI